MRGLGALLVSFSSLSWLIGCTQGLESRSFQTRVISGASVDEVFRAAEVLLRREFGPLEIEPDTHRIVSQPVEYQTATESGTARDLYRAPSTMRRTANLRATPCRAGVAVRLRIDVERKDTERREVFQPDKYRLSDAPGQTPIERDAATSERQNTVWTFVKRDQRLERALLGELEAQFAPPPEQGPPLAEERSAKTP